ncbi:MAG: hypothetical protein M3345_00945 [Actinomycetota bacterium]|nr:hypothetical protein [Actinomycetota bacterium]
MNPLVKKVVGALALKEAWDRVQEARQPQKPSIWARLRKLLLVTGAGGGAYYLYKSGKLDPVVGQVTGRKSSSGSSSTWSYDEDRVPGQGSLGSTVSAGSSGINSAPVGAGAPGSSSTSGSSSTES